MNFRAMSALLLASFGLIGGTGQAFAVPMPVQIDTAALAGTAARLEFSLLDGDSSANNGATINNLTTDGSLGSFDCSLSCAGGPPFVISDAGGLGQLLQDLTLGTFISFDLDFSPAFSGSGDPDLLVLSLLDPSSNFSLIDTHLDAPAGAVPYQDALVVLDLATGALRQAAVPEPSTLGLMLLGLLACGRRTMSARNEIKPCTQRGERTMKPSFHDRNRLSGLTLGMALAVFALAPAQAANHREAPLTAIDTKADITDWFAFVSYDDPTKVTMILDVDPLLEPSNGPNYFPFDHEILYEMKVDNDFDADEDIKIQFRFGKPEIRLPGVFTGFVGAGAGVNTPPNSPPPIAPETPLIPPTISKLDGPGSEGLSLRQTYTVAILKKVGNRWRKTFDSGVRKLIAVPSNVGPRTMQNYDALARQGIYDLGGGVKVFAGTVDDPFYIDLGAAFDSFNFRAGASAPGLPPGVLSDDQDADDTQNFASDDVSGFNVNAIAIELPITMLTSDGQPHPATDAAAVIGTYATTSRPRIKVQPAFPGGKPALSANFVQIQRMGNALFNELIIGTGDKDKFSMSEPKNDAQFASHALDPLLARVFNAISGGAVQIPTPPRADPNHPQVDLGPLVFYAAPICPGCTPQQRGPVADLLRLNTGIPATPQANRKRLGFIAGDVAGYPNGRRVSDDVTDISARAVVGLLAGPPFNGFPNNRIGDGTNANDRVYQETFPYVAFANDGRNSRHVDPSEAGCADVVAPFPAVPCPTN
jgi:hypothetical protein